MLRKTDDNTKIKDIEDKILCITNLAITCDLNAVKKKICNVSNLAKKQIMMQKYQTLNLLSYSLSNFFW